MPGAAPLLILVEATSALGYLCAAALSYEAFRRNGRGTDGVLAVGLMLAAFSPVLFAVHPGTYSSVVTAGDLLRVAFYATLLATLDGRGAATSGRCVRPTTSSIACANPRWCARPPTSAP